MPIELHIQNGALAGVRQSFNKSVISIGRHPTSDLRFDPEIDLDVSTRHGEIRVRDGQYTIHDLQSTNGTFVNGVRVPPGGSAPVGHNDLVSFGPEGPKALVRIVAPAPPPVATPPVAPPAFVPPPPKVAQPVAPPPSPAPTPAPTPAPAPKPAASAPRPATIPKPAPRPTSPPRPVASTSSRDQQDLMRRPTEERVAVAVRHRTRGLRNALIATIVILGGVAGGIFYKGARDASARDTRIRELLAENEQISSELRTTLQGDTTFTNSLQRHNDSLTQAVRDARGVEQAAAASLELRRSHEVQRQFASMGLPAVREANDGAVVLISSTVNSQSFESTGFSVSSTGLIVTNRHVIVDSDGARATRIFVKFANTGEWLHAHLLKLPENPETDLALLQVDSDRSTFPSVHDVASEVDIPVGTSIATLGYPLGTDLPMEGNGSDEIAKTSLTIGTVSKSVPGVLQIDAFASHGSSGSPVFDGHGHVIGVVWGGPRDGQGRIVFAVPAEEIKKLLR